MNADPQISGSEPRTRLRWFWVVLIVVFACAFQGTRPIYSPDEGRYTDVALGMLDSGDWIRPTLHPEFEHWAKPPLTYWAIASSVAVFGRNEFAARLPNGLALAGAILLVFWGGRRLVPQQPWLPALIYATCIAPFAAANMVTTDTLLTLWETLQFAAFAVLWWPIDAREERMATLIFWLGAALAFLTKGPPGLLILAACLVFAFGEQRWRGLARVLRWRGLAIFFLVGFSWYVVAVIREPGVLRYFLVEEVYNRVATDKMHRNGAWYDGFKVYLPTLLLGTLPWIPFYIAKMWKKRHQFRGEIRESAPLRFALFCIALPLIVFMISKSRLPLYVLPIFAPLAVLMALALAPIDLSSTSKKALLVAWCVLLLAVRIVPAHFDIFDDDKRLADALIKELPAAPTEIAFVETAPRFGLRFYLESTIERLTLPGRSQLPASEDFAEEMREDEGCRVLMVDASNLRDTQTELDTLHIDYRRLADVRGYSVFIQHTKDCTAYAGL